MDVTATLQIIAASSSLQEQEDTKKQLAAYLNNLVLNDFPALLQVLYRIDVSEQKLKTVLRENPQADAGDLLAELLLQRQKEKELSRQFFSANAKPPAEEGW